MIERVLTAPEYLMGDDKNIPLIFLGGPIQGAWDWQKAAINVIASHTNYVRVANPKRNERFTGDFAAEKYIEQTRWEREHLEKASKNGAVMFWLAKESEKGLFRRLKDEYTAFKAGKNNRAYAQTSRIELGMYVQKHILQGANLVIGIDDGFTGARYIRDLVDDVCKDVKIYSTLEETCDAAVELCYKK